MQHTGSVVGATKRNKGGGGGEGTKQGKGRESSLPPLDGSEIQMRFCPGRV